jgi:magnesium chelatase family protein
MVSVTFPAEFLLVASMNPCPCGNLGHPGKACRCTPTLIRRYLSRVSGPLMDRIDIHAEVAPPAYDELSGRGVARESPGVRERVKLARDAQTERVRSCAAQALPGGGRPSLTNARMPASLLSEQAKLEPAASSILKTAVAKLGLSARAYHKVLRIARTIADLDGSATVCSEHVCEAIQYRSLDRRR